MGIVEYEIFAVLYEEGIIEYYELAPDLEK